MAAGLLVLAAGLLWLSSRFIWVRLRAFDGLGEPRTIAVSGQVWSQALVPMAVALLAAALAILAIRGWALRVLALLIAAVGAGAAYLGVGIWAVTDVAPRAARAASVPVYTLVGADRLHGGAVVALLAALLAVAAAMVLLRGVAAGSATRYRTPAARRADNADIAPTSAGERAMWDSLDDGHDPTAEPS